MTQELYSTAIAEFGDALRARCAARRCGRTLQLGRRGSDALGAAAFELARELLEAGGGTLGLDCDRHVLRLRARHPRLGPQSWQRRASWPGLQCQLQEDTLLLSAELPCPPSPHTLTALGPELERLPAPDATAALVEGNDSLLDLLSALDAQTSELEETNRGVVALYAELDERAQYLQRTTEVKSRFLSNMTHEFRTPLNSVLSLSEILLQRLDGPLSSEQEKQIRFIKQSAEGLSELVNDLLDLAKVEAGKLSVRPSDFTVDNLFATLRGMLRPLLAERPELELVFEPPGELPILHTDEAKVSQILRNFISNAIKYTERGEIRVSAELKGADTIAFSVADTGIGISHEDQSRVFDEFTQIEHPLQKRTKGTGLGLPLSRRLAQLLGGNIGVRSRLGAGSTFYAALPVNYQSELPSARRPEIGRLDPDRAPVLVVEDNSEWLFIYEQFLEPSGFQMLTARTVAEAREWLGCVRPAAIVLDVLLETESTWDFLSELKQDAATVDIPVAVVTVVANEARARALGADAFKLKPVERDWLLRTLDEFTSDQPKLLVIDEDEISRYLLRDLLSDAPYTIIETASAEAGLEAARSQQPRAIFVDPMGSRESEIELLDALKADPALAAIPVFVYTAAASATDSERFAAASAVLSKNAGSRAAAREHIRQALQDCGLVCEEHHD